jgi:hypothetical protein
MEEMGVGRQARMKRFSLDGSSSVGSVCVVLHGDEGFLLPVIGTVSTRRQSTAHSHLPCVVNAAPGEAVEPAALRSARAAAAAP